MSQLIDKDALAAEIERRIENNTEWKDACKTLAVLAANQAIEEDKKILSIINAFEVKEINFERNGKDCKDDPVSEDLEHAATDYLISIRLGDHNLTKAFKAGAYWQKQKDDEMLTVVYMDGMEKGKKMVREQMMKETIDFLKSYRRETPDKTGYIAGIIDDTTIEDYRKLWEG